MDVTPRIVGYSSLTGIISAAYTYLVPKQKVHSKFYYYYFLNQDRDKSLFAIGKGIRVTLREDSFGSLFAPFPSYDEQKIIADYLDTHSAKITHFIQTKQRFIELLKEQRQSIITNAVTKGINERAKMKKTDVEWISEIPAHWAVRRLRFVGHCQNGINKGEEYFGSGFPFVSYTDVYKNEVLPSELNGLAISSDEDRTNYSVNEGDVFFTRTSETAEEIGISSVCLQTIPKATFSGFLIRFRPINNILYPGFSKYYFRCNIHRAFFVKEMLIVTRASLSQNLLKNLIVLIPPFQEQKQIEKYINTETKTLDIAINKAEREIELIKEYREAMIAEAVTGKHIF
jgi:type I restriction enzyme S subunit